MPNFFRRDAGPATATAPKPPSSSGSTAYERKRAKEGAKQRKQSAAAREISPIPPVKDPARKARALESFQAFLESYFPARFTLAWSVDHLQAIADYQRIIVHGGLKSLAMPRSSGKTTIAECGAIWAVLKGLRGFVTLIGQTEEKAEQLLKSIETELQTNDLLYEDFPEVLHAVRAIEGETKRKPLFEGRRIRMKFTAKMIILPDIPANPSSAAIIRVAGLTSSIRGMAYSRPDGRKVRPDLVLLDDPQTDESANSPSQCATREKLILGSVLGLAGPGVKIACMMLCTVIRSGDLADRFLTHKIRPEWQGQRTKMLYALPMAMEKWEAYERVRNEGLSKGDNGAAGNAFYLADYEAMRVGARIGWEGNKDPDDIDALQHAMNLRMMDLRVFQAEYQNDPIDETQKDAGLLTADEIAAKVNNVPRGEVPAELETATCFVDVQGEILFWLVGSWGANFSGAIVDYGSYPDQQREYFTNADIRHPLSAAFEGRGVQGRIYGGLERLVAQLAARVWNRHGGGSVRLARIMIDSGHETDTIYQFCRQSAHASLVIPSKGIGVSAKRPPMNTWGKKPNDVRRGQSWIISRHDGRGIPHVVYDTNFWKTFLHQRLSTPAGDHGSLSLCGTDPRPHRMLADHLTAEKRTKTEGQGRELFEWSEPPGIDNHWFDCAVGSAVLASIEGVTLPEWGTTKRERRQGTVPEHLRPGGRR